MLKTNANYVFLTVRSSSSRLPKKCFLPFGEFNVLGHVINRAKFFDLIPIVCTSDHPSDDEIESMSNKAGVTCFRGSLKNKLKRWHQCALTAGIDIFHTIDVDDPFFDPIQVIESLNILRKMGLDFVSPTEISSSGSASVGYSIRRDFLESIINIFEHKEEIEMVDTVFAISPNSKGQQLVSETLEIANVRLTLDYIEDYHLLLFVVQILGPYASRAEIAQLFSNNPDLFRINWFRNKEWQANQNSIRSGAKHFT